MLSMHTHQTCLIETLYYLMPGFSGEGEGVAKLIGCGTDLQYRNNIKEICFIYKPDNIFGML